MKKSKLKSNPRGAAEHPTMDAIDWLLEKDDHNPSVRYLALRDLLELPESHAEVCRAQDAILRCGPAPVILNAQEPDGFWVKPGSGYSPKYRATVWSLLILAKLGIDPSEPRVRKGCEYLLSHSVAENGAFSAYQHLAPSGALLCLNGNLIYALQRMGFGGDVRLQTAIEWLAQAIVGEPPVEYYPTGTAAPNFVCGVNDGLACAWGANKALRGLLTIPESERTPLVKRALEAGGRFLLSRDPVVAD